MIVFPHFMKALNNIAAIGLAIDVPNKAIDLLKNAPTCNNMDKVCSSFV